MKIKMIGNEYRTTVVCIDSYDNRVLAGRLYNPYCPDGKEFRSLIEFMLVMERLLDEMNFPQPFDGRRTFQGADARTVRWVKSGERSLDTGKCATFQLRVLFRQNASWQGSVRWVEGQLEESFRSVLELMLLMDGALIQSTGEAIEETGKSIPAD